VSDVVKLLEDKPEKPNYEDAQYGSALGLDPNQTLASVLESKIESHYGPVLGIDL